MRYTICGGCGRMVPVEKKESLRQAGGVSFTVVMERMSPHLKDSTAIRSDVCQGSSKMVRAFVRPTEAAA